MCPYRHFTGTEIDNMLCPWGFPLSLRRGKAPRKGSHLPGHCLEDKNLDLQTNAMHSRTPLKPVFIARNQACMRIGCQLSRTRIGRELS